MLITLEEAREIIHPDLAGCLARCSANAFDDWFSEVSIKARANCSSSTKANFVNDQMIFYAKQMFPEGNPYGVTIVKINNREQLLIKDKIFIKMKKFNWSMRTANIPTASVIYYNSQLQPPLNSQLYMFPQEDNIAHLMNGYIEDSLKIGMKPFIVCPNGKQNYWVWPLDFETKPTGTQVALLDMGSPSGLNPKPVAPKTPNIPIVDVEGIHDDSAPKSLQP